MVKSLLRICALILDSNLFIGISIIGFFFIITHILPILDARDISKGDKPHFYFYVVASAKDKEKPLSALSLFAFEPSLYGKEFEPIDTSESSFLLPDAEGKFSEKDLNSFSYNVTTLSAKKQLVEVHWYGDDYSSISRYVAEENRIQPLYSELTGINTMFLSIPITGIISLMLCVVGKKLRRKYLVKYSQNNSI